MTAIVIMKKDILTLLYDNDHFTCDGCNKIFEVNTNILNKVIIDLVEDYVKRKYKDETDSSL